MATVNCLAMSFGRRGCREIVDPMVAEVDADPAINSGAASIVAVRMIMVLGVIALFAGVARETDHRMKTAFPLDPADSVADVAPAETVREAG